ncbi:Choline transporter-like protein 1 [Halotydeus destructor]|nr:Choline transporter-like protein 1 [Halotydeus destructor]
MTRGRSSGQKVFTLPVNPVRSMADGGQLPSLNLPHIQSNAGHQFYQVISNPDIGSFSHGPLPPIRETGSPEVTQDTASPFVYLNSRPEPEIPSKNRRCQDCFVAMLFILFIAFLSYVLYDIIANNKSNPMILLHGYDNFGNICGQDNEPISMVDYSGTNMTGKPYVMISLYNNVTLKTTCISHCPKSEFFLTVFNRCLPRNSTVALPLLIMDAFNVSRTVLEAVVTDTFICWKEITYSASISFVFSLIILIMLRYLASLVIWSSLVGLTLFSGLGTTYIWLKWNIQRQRLSLMSSVNVQRLQQLNLTDQWFMGAVTCTVAWIIFVLILLVMRKRIQLAAILFREAGKAIGCMPFILLQPFWTFAVLVLLCASWLYSLIHLQSVREAVVDIETHFVTYQVPEFYKQMKWYHMFAIIWLVHFILACQHFVIGSSISRWYFSRLKGDLHSPILRSIAILATFHIGSIALGSLFVASVKMTRLLFKRMEVILVKYKSSCSILAKLCHCCLWTFEKVLIFINRNVYIEIAIHGKSYCKSAERAFTVISTNALRVATVNSVGDFLLFLGKLSIVLMTLFVSAKLVEDKERHLTYSWAPVLVSGVSAYFVAHCFLSVYEMAIDTLLICFCEDCAINDGLNRPYYMSSTLLGFVDDHQTLTKRRMS